MTRTCMVAARSRGQERAGWQVMDDKLIERAVEAAAKAMSEHWRDMHTNESLGRQRMLAQHAVTAALAEVETSLTAERDALTEGRCLADITHRDDGHRMSICVLPKGHTTAHDDALGCTWTDADHWQPSERDDLAASVARVEALHRPVDIEVFTGDCAAEECDRAGEGELRAYCDECGVFAPCPTIKALRGES